MNEGWFTFGQTHTHSVNGFTFDKDVVVHIVADDPRSVMVECFGLAWAMHYPEIPNMKFYPRGVYSFAPIEVESLPITCEGKTLEQMVRVMIDHRDRGYPTT